MKKHTITVTISGPPKSGKTLLAYFLKSMIEDGYADLQFNAEVLDEDSTPSKIKKIMSDPDIYGHLNGCVKSVVIRQKTTWAVPDVTSSKKKPVKK